MIKRILIAIFLYSVMCVRAENGWQTVSVDDAYPQSMQEYKTQSVAEAQMAIERAKQKALDDINKQMQEAQHKMQKHIDAQKESLLHWVETSLSSAIESAINGTVNGISNGATRVYEGAKNRAVRAYDWAFGARQQPQ